MNDPLSIFPNCRTWESEREGGRGKGDDYTCIYELIYYIKFWSYTTLLPQAGNRKVDLDKRKWFFNKPVTTGPVLTTIIERFKLCYF